MTRPPWALRALFMAVGVWVASIAPFVAVILRERGIDALGIGLVSAVSALAATLIVPAAGAIADVRVGRARAFRVTVVAATAVAMVLVLPIPVAAVAAVVATFGAIIGVGFALGDALAIDGLSAPERQYGALRALSSLSFAVGVVGAGLLYDRAGYAAAPFACLATAGLILPLLGRVKDSTRDPAARAPTRSAGAHGSVGTAGRFGAIGLAFRIQPRLLAVLLGLMVAFTGLQGAVLFVAVQIVQLGGQPSDVALSLGLAALMEVPGLVTAGWLARRIGLRWLFILSTVPFAVCIASWGVLPSPMAIIATRLVTGYFFGTLTAARVLAVPRLLPASLQATGQSLTQAATLGLGSVLGALIGGAMYGSAGAEAYFVTSAVLACVGGVGVWFALRGPIGGRQRAGLIMRGDVAEPTLLEGTISA